MTDALCVMPRRRLIRRKSLTKPKVQVWSLPSMVSRGVSKKVLCVLSIMNAVSIRKRSLASPSAIVPCPEVVVVLKEIDLPDFLASASRVVLEEGIPFLEVTTQVG